jgi:hypothetical protein
LRKAPEFKKPKLEEDQSLRNIMRRFDRKMRIASVVALGLSLSACEYLENLMDTKKPLPGERKPVFADGVPGVPQGVPPELVRGYQAPPASQPTVDVPIEKPKPVAQPKPRVRPESRTVAVPVRSPATTITVQPNTPGAALPPAAWPAPAASTPAQQPPAQQPTQQSTTQPPAWPAPGGGAQAPGAWPTPPSAGSR